MRKDSKEEKKVKKERKKKKVRKRKSVLAGVIFIALISVFIFESQRVSCKHMLSANFELKIELTSYTTIDIELFKYDADADGAAANIE